MANSVTVLHNGTNVEQWRQAEKSDNATDLCSRREMNQQLLETCAKGAEFLSLSEEHRIVNSFSYRPQQAL